MANLHASHKAQNQTTSSGGEITDDTFAGSDGLCFPCTWLVQSAVVAEWMERKRLQLAKCRC
jgi:hypothetical protein